MANETDKRPQAPANFTIFRKRDARPHVAKPAQGLTEVSAAGLARLREAGMMEGAEACVLFEAPGFSVMYAHFKSGFPLFRHAHGPDCLYQVIGGSLQIGDEVLRKGDGFFLPANTPYAFAPGPEGVEVLEIRHEPIRDTVVMANNPAFWVKALEVVSASQDRWRDEPLPST